MPRLTRSGRTRRYLRIAAADNAREAAAVTPESIARDLRRRAVEQHPDMSAAEVEERVARALERGMRRSPPPPPPAPPPPSAALVA